MTVQGGYVTSDNIVKSSSYEISLPYQAKNLSQDTKREMKKVLGRAAWQICKGDNISDDTKASAKKFINDIRDDEEGSKVWEDIEVFTDKVPGASEAALDVVKAVVHMFYS
jgi:hypothetical protein